MAAPTSPTPVRAAAPTTTAAGVAAADPTTAAGDEDVTPLGALLPAACKPVGAGAGRLPSCDASPPPFEICCVCVCVCVCVRACVRACARAHQIRTSTRALDDLTQRARSFSPTHLLVLGGGVRRRRRVAGQLSRVCSPCLHFHLAPILAHSLACFLPIALTRNLANCRRLCVHVHKARGRTHATHIRHSTSYH